MGKKQIEKSLTTFKSRVQQRFQHSKILLFGSFAKGKTNTYSDIDVLVVSPEFRKISQEKRLDVLYDLTKGLRPDFHVFGYTPQELQKAHPVSTLADIKETAITI